MSDHSSHSPMSELEASLEALLFVAAAPVTVNQLAEALEVKQSEVEQSLNDISQRYSEAGGLSLQWHGGKVQLTTAPRYGALVERFLGLEATARLTRAAIETMTIVAYRQPITRPGIDSIRGVNSDGVLKSLLSKGLIEEVGRTEGPGRPILYGTTSDFLQYFGLTSLTDLPPYELVEETVKEEGHPKILKD